MEYLIMRKIEIDAGHRIPDHGSKCRSIHGHRYVIEATCRGPLHAAGEQQGMELDFGFIKELMIKHIDEPCDHGTILFFKDEYLPKWLPEHVIAHNRVAEHHFDAWPHTALVKLYVLDVVPTVENLAAHWYARLGPAVAERTEDKATLVNVRVWETPNCYADFPGV